MKNDGAKIFPFQTLIFNIFRVERISCWFLLESFLEGVKLCRLAARWLTWRRRKVNSWTELHGQRNVVTKDGLVTFYTLSETMTQTLITSFGSAINGHATSPSSGHFKLNENFSSELKLVQASSSFNKKWNGFRQVEQFNYSKNNWFQFNWLK